MENPLLETSFNSLESSIFLFSLGKFIISIKRAAEIVELTVEGIMDTNELKADDNLPD